MTDAYPALFIVPKPKENDNGVTIISDPPSEDTVTEIVTDALNLAGWSPDTSLTDVRRGTRDLQDEYPPKDPVPTDGVTVVFDQLPATEAEGYQDGPFEVAKKALGDELHVEVWIDAVVR